MRLDCRAPRVQGSILYCTTGILLQRLQSDPRLLQFSHIIIDEIHERDVFADLVLVVIKQLLPARPDLRLVLMSATLNADQFSAYMGGCPVVRVPGKMFPVTSIYIEQVLEWTQFDLAASLDYGDREPAQQEESVLTDEKVRSVVHSTS